MKSFLKKIFKVPVCVALLLSVLLTASVSGSEANHDSAASSDSNSWENSSDWDEVNLFPLFYHNKEKTWIFPTIFSDEERTTVLPLFSVSKNLDSLWVFPFSWYTENSVAIFPLFIKSRKSDYLWVFPFSWYASKESFGIPPLLFNREGVFVIPPILVSTYSPDRIKWLNVLLILYNYSHYSGGKSKSESDYSGGKSESELDHYSHNILGGLLFRYEGYENSHKYFLSVLTGLLWSSEQREEESEKKILWGSLFRSIKNSEKHLTSLLLFSHTRYLNGTKGDSWSFCWGLFEKHDGGGHIFYIPHGKSEEE